MPAVLVIHAGGNDLGVVRVPELLTMMRADIERLPTLFQGVTLVWSEIIPRMVWRLGSDPAGMERARRSINARVSRFIRAQNGVVVRHRQLEGVNDRYMAPDGVHLNGDGIEVFLAGIREGVRMALSIVGGGRRPV